MICSAANAKEPSNADLLKMIDVLQQQIEVLKKQVEANTAKKKMEPHIPPKGALSGKSDVKLTISGQVNRAAMILEDGDESDIYHVDNDNSSTRLRLIGKAELSEKWSAGSQIEVQFRSNSSSEVDQKNQRDIGTNSFTERKLEIYFDHDNFGRLWMGQGDTASNHSTEQDLSGTGLAGDSNINEYAGSLLFRDKDTDSLTNIEIGDAFSNLDGLSRDDRARYDTPRFHGFMLSASAISDSRWDGSINLKSRYGNFVVKGQLGFGNVNSGTKFNRLSGSFSTLHAPTGLSFTFAAGRDDLEDTSSNNPDFFYSKLGYQKNLFTVGKSAVSIDYFRANDFNSNGSNGDIYGFQFVQKINRISTEIYAGLRNSNHDEISSNLHDLLVSLIGARVKF